MIFRNFSSQDGQKHALLKISVFTCALISVYFFVRFPPFLHFQKGTRRLQSDLSQRKKIDSRFWTPINIDNVEDDDPIIILCKLDFVEYSSSPHKYPMAKDFEAMSSCEQGANIRKRKLSVLLADLANSKGTPKGRFLTPTGFVFHESRVGSTLVANALASDPSSMVFSESHPPSRVLKCSTCSRERKIQLFRDVVTLMGRSPVHKHLFFKFQAFRAYMDIPMEV